LVVTVDGVDVEGILGKIVGDLLVLSGAIGLSPRLVHSRGRHLNLVLILCGSF
jgi:hypothetical protein